MKKLLKIAMLYRSLIMLMLIGFFVSGCTCTSERMHPQFQSYRQSMGVMLVLVPEIGIFEQMADGSRLFQDIQSQEAQRSAQQSITDQLLKRRFEVQAASPAMMRNPEIMSVTSLFRSVNHSIQLHTFGPQIFPAKLSAFDYNLGPVADILKTYKADGLVLALGHQTGAELPARNWLSIAVVEPDGHIIWCGMQGDHNKFDLQIPNSVAALVAYTMNNFWESGS